LSRNVGSNDYAKVLPLRRLLETPVPSKPSPGHNLAAARADLPRYTRLYELTAAAAEPVLQEGLAAVTAQSASALFEEEFRNLLRFVDESDQEARPAEDEIAQREVFAGLRADLQKSLANVEPHVEPNAGDQNLARELSHEFARVFWSAMLRYLRADGRQGEVEPEVLLPKSGEANDVRQMEMLQLITAHFKLTNAELHTILRRTLVQLLNKSDPEERRILLPLGLSVDKTRLKQRIESTPSFFKTMAGLSLDDAQLGRIRPDWSNTVG
jgi:hypothetical protein